MEKEKEIDAIKLLELYKASNFAGSGKFEAESRNRIDEAILEIYRIIDEKNMYKRQSEIRSKMVEKKREVLKKHPEWKKKKK